jgi:hypothetical protein
MLKVSALGNWNGAPNMARRDLKEFIIIITMGKSAMSE